jgi:sulfotransferase family protein
MDPTPAFLAGPSLLVAASSHRSGSTLLQRYVTAMSDLFVWGESDPLIESLRRTYEAWPGSRKNEGEYHASMADPSFMERNYTPNLSPPRAVVLDAFREAIVRIYGDNPDGFERWGWKAVQYGEAEMDFVRLLFPEIRMLLLVRDPYDVARSVRRKGWIDKRGYFTGVREVAEHWVERTSHFVRLRDANDDRLLFVRYEELGDSLSDIDTFIGGVPDDPNKRRALLRKRLGTAPAVSRFSLTPHDLDTVGEVAGDLADSLGYARP